MEETRVRRFWWRTGQFLSGSVGLVLLTFAAFRLRAAPATAALLYFFSIVLFSLWAGFLPCLLISLLAILCFDYFFPEPLYNLTISQPGDFEP